MMETYWNKIPGMPIDDISGKLIVLEGTDGVGRSTQITMVKQWLESSGLAVHDTGLTRSILAGRDLQLAKDGHTMGSITQALYYATDFADRFENEMLPALKAGYVVLTDRYIYSLIARAVVRGCEENWTRRVYGFAIVPDMVLYLKADLDTLIPRVLASGGFDYWESGADYIHAASRYDSFVLHQEMLLKQFDSMVDEFNFTVVDASRSVKTVFDDLRMKIAPVVQDMRSLDQEYEFIPDEMPLRRGGPAASSRSVSDIIADLLSALQDQ